MNIQSTFFGGTQLKYVSISYPFAKLRISRNGLILIVAFFYKIEFPKSEIESIEIGTTFFGPILLITHSNKKFRGQIKFAPFPKSSENVLASIKHYSILD